MGLGEVLDTAGEEDADVDGEAAVEEMGVVFAGFEEAGGAQDGEEGEGAVVEGCDF